MRLTRPPSAFGNQKDSEEQWPNSINSTLPPRMGRAMVNRHHRESGINHLNHLEVAARIFNHLTVFLPKVVNPAWDHELQLRRAFPNLANRTNENQPELEALDRESRQAVAGKSYEIHGSTTGSGTGSRTLGERLDVRG